MKITKEQFERIYYDLITVAELNDTVAAIDKRFSQIMDHIIYNKKHHCQWYDYDNCDYDSEDSHGSFDKERYKDDILFGGENLKVPEPYQESFPTRWLWEDFEEEFAREVEKALQENLRVKKQTQEKYAKRKADKQALIETIKSKLTPEELKLVKFK